MSDQNTRPQPSTEPVAWMYQREGTFPRLCVYRVDEVHHGWTETPLYPASALEAARREALEEAAKVADWCATTPATIPYLEAERIARLIRALKENTNG